MKLKYPCANSTCPNSVDKAGDYCEVCQKRERDAERWINRVLNNAEKERIRRKRQQDNAHRKDGEE